MVPEAKEQFLFDPDKFEMNEDLYNLEEHALSTAELKHYGELATQIRGNFEQKAKAIVDNFRQEEQLDVESKVFVPHKLRRFYTPVKERAQPNLKADFKEIELPARKNTACRRKLRRHTVSQIINAVMAGGKTQQEVALQFGTTEVLVGKLVRDYRNGKGVLNKLKADEENRTITMTAAVKVIQAFIDRKQNIWRAAQIVEEVKGEGAGHHHH